MGFVYDTVDDDYQHALNEYELAAKAGDAVGEFNAGLVYETGKGRAVDYQKAADYYLQAANQGHVQAMVQLAGVYLNGLHDEDKALSWYQKAADLGDAGALYQLGLLSETGVGTKLDYATAVKYYQQASDKGNANAKFALARMNQHGLGMPKDPQAAAKFYKELADLNNAYAQYQLGKLYYDGALGAAMPQEGLKWLQLAEQNGSVQARIALQKLTPKVQDKLSMAGH